jgi:crossover junction endodeoxyribonuclease RuvC
MRILGIDPGYASLGLGLLELDNNKIRYITSWLVVTRKERPMPERLAELSRDMSEILKAAKPDEVAIEQLFFWKNATTCIQVAQARGVILSRCAHIPVSEYTPQHIKMLATGRGRASKNDMKKAIEYLVSGLKDDNVIDGIGIALAHARILLNTSDHRQGVKG